MPAVINASLAINLLREAVEAEGEDHEVFECSYVDLETKEPLCIVAHALHSVIGESFCYKMDDGHNSKSIAVLAPFLLRVFDVDITVPALRVFRDAQLAQDDDGGTWGDALDEAEIAFENVSV